MATTDFPHALGDEMRDIITGYTGIAVAEHRYLNGCVRFEIQPQTLLPDGKTADLLVFDREQLEIVTAGKVKPRLAHPDPVGRATRGGPRTEPARAAVPTR